ncbi:hypothetical protein GCM10010304_61520 [Streptomyces roseoviolaceus]
MTRPTPATTTTRICPTCDGFPTVAIASGARDRHGHLPTTTVDCPTCSGTGTAPLRPRLTTADLGVSA